MEIRLVEETLSDPTVSSKEIAMADITNVLPEHSFAIITFVVVGWVDSSEIYLNKKVVFYPDGIFGLEVRNSIAKVDSLLPTVYLTMVMV